MIFNFVVFEQPLILGTILGLGLFSFEQNYGIKKTNLIPSFYTIQSILTIIACNNI